MVDNQFDEIIRILAANVAQLLHIYYLSLTSQRLIDYSNELQNVMYAFVCQQCLNNFCTNF